MSDVPDTAVWRALDMALDNAEDERVRYHVREAMQLHQAQQRGEADA